MKSILRLKISGVNTQFMIDTIVIGVHIYYFYVYTVVCLKSTN